MLIRNSESNITVMVKLRQNLAIAVFTGVTLTSLSFFAVLQVGFDSETRGLPLPFFGSSTASIGCLNTNGCNASWFPLGVAFDYGFWFVVSLIAVAAVSGKMGKAA